MAVVANDLAFFGHHSVAALGAGVKEFFGFVRVGALVHFLADIQEGWKALDDRGFLGQVFVHKTSLAWPFGGLNSPI